ncbi:MAG: PadR family transcriptional regulator [Granulosicoccus sp.]
MALKFVLLTLLNRSSQTGYEIVKTFDSAVGYFWNASHQQVYRELATLTESELVRFKLVAQKDKPDKKIYTISARGKKALLAWLEEPVKTQATKDLLLVKLLNTTPGNASLMLLEINYGIEESKQRLDIYRNIEQQHFTSADLQGMVLESRMLHLALRKGILSIEANLAWLHEARATLESS